MLLPPDSVLVGVHLEKKAWGLIKTNRGKILAIVANPPNSRCSDIKHHHEFNPNPSSVKKKNLNAKDVSVHVSAMRPNYLLFKLAPHPRWVEQKHLRLGRPRIVMFVCKWQGMRAIRGRLDTSSTFRNRTIIFIAFGATYSIQ